jgi:very-short-patch-repair endonuclease
VTRIYNRTEVKETRRYLRRNLAPAEALLWSRLQRKQLLGLRFRRQYSVGPYVLDFYCPELKLAVEIDGSTHVGDDAERRDRARQSHIEQYDIRFLRFADNDVLKAVDGVLDYIARTAERLRRGETPEPPPTPPWQGGEHP